jgi:hypothetical protein
VSADDYCGPHQPQYVRTPWRGGTDLLLRKQFTVPAGTSNLKVGVAVANAVPERALELSFAGVQLVVAWQLAGTAGLR